MRRLPSFVCVLGAATLFAIAPGSTSSLSAAPQEHAAPTAQAPGAAEHAAAPADAHGAPATQPAASTHTDPAHQPPAAGHGADQHAQPAGGHEGEEHGGGHEAESPWAMVARLFNFGVLAGTLVYLLRSPFADYLKNRSVQIRSDLSKAAEMRESASKQLTVIEQRMAGLPAELDALKKRGAEEIAAEEQRIREAATRERERMLSQARREIDLQLRLAERELIRRAGELAVDVATARVRQTITDADHARLVQRYLQQVRN